MARFEGRTFEDQEVELDGNEYVGCKITRCVIVVRGNGPTKMSGCEMKGCSISLRDAAAQTIDDLYCIYHGLPGGREFVESLFAQIRTMSN